MHRTPPEAIALLAIPHFVNRSCGMAVVFELRKYLMRDSIEDSEELIVIFMPIGDRGGNVSRAGGPSNFGFERKSPAHIEKAALPSPLDTHPFIQCHQVTGRAEAGGVANQSARLSAGSAEDAANAQ